ncbi:MULTISPECIES: outer membrane protein assembly factor BamB [unclassified Paludibacterium]|uniref:outer membrane protein assembly factor BamB n=1 Tax=unclassified Paludibacterium TaxID=2618429 RepID=UPI001C050EF3|nr:outer membrane protein assembly factor BamB [Paludibacterium sp. B53371]BEV73846.1 outer membrane protein assembly factor BamB [Paludibacterium sp. THUN1379]
MRQRLLLVLLSTSMLGGCASWFQSSSRPEPTPLAAIQQVQALKVNWSESASAGVPGSFLPTYDRGEVLVADPQGELRIYNADTGRQSNRLGLKRELSAGPGVAGNTVLLGTSDGFLLAVDRASGKTLWQQRLTSVTLEAPVVSGSVAVVRTNDDRISGFQISDGKQLWSLPHFQGELLVRNTGSLTAVAGSDVLLAGLSGGKMQVIAAQNGNVLWEGVVASPKGATELERVTDVVSRPQFADQQVCAVAYQGRVACFDSRSGNLVWAREVSSSRAIALDAQNVYVTDENDSVLAFDRQTGRNVWKQDALKFRGLSGPAMLGRFVLVVDAQGYAHLLSNESGSIVGRVGTGTDGQTAQPVSLGTSALVKGPNGRLVMLSLG